MKNRLGGAVHTGRGDAVPSVGQDPSLLLLFTTLPAISRAGALKSLRPADRIRMLPKSGFRGGSRKHRWEPCTRPPGPVQGLLSASWNRHGGPLRPWKGVEAKNEVRATREQEAGSTSERKKQGAHSPPGHWMLKYEESIGGGGGTPSGASLPCARAQIPAPCR